MSRNKKSCYIILAIAFVLFNVIIFAVPTDKTSVFWITYTFTVVAFAMQIAVWKVAFSKAETLKSKFLGLPLIYVGVIYLVIQSIAFVVFMFLPTIPGWIPIVTCTIILSVSGIFLTSTELGREEVVRVEEKIQQNVSAIKGLQIDVEGIAEAQTDPVAKKALESLAEKIKYSDPMSDESLARLDDEIKTKIGELKTRAASDIPGAVKDIELLLLDRNKKTKLLK